MWNDLKVKDLRAIASKYKALHSLGNVSKQPKSVLVETLKKVMEWRGMNLFTKAEHGNKKVIEVAEQEPTPKTKPKTADDKKVPNLEITTGTIGKEKVNYFYSTSTGNAYDVVYSNELDRDKVVWIGNKATKTSFNRFDERKNISPETRFFYPNEKPFTFLNDIMEANDEKAIAQKTKSKEGRDKAEQNAKMLYDEYFNFKKDNKTLEMNETKKKLNKVVKTLLKEDLKKARFPAKVSISTLTKSGKTERRLIKTVITYEVKDYKTGADKYLEAFITGNRKLGEKDLKTMSVNKGLLEIINKYYIYSRGIEGGIIKDEKELETLNPFNL
jgi:hypothetical protein